MYSSRVDDSTLVQKQKCVGYCDTLGLSYDIMQVNITPDVNHFDEVTRLVVAGKIKTIVVYDDYVVSDDKFIHSILGIFGVSLVFVKK